MIDWNKTKLETGFNKEYFIKYPSSHKKVYAICNECNKLRLVNYSAYRNLCLSCVRKGNKNPMYNTHRSGKDNPFYGKHHSDENKVKLSCSRQGINIENFDGFSKQKYCYKFNELLKTKIRNNYNNCDYISGLHKDICNIINNKVLNLDVHHISYNKEDGCNGEKFNLIPLSHINHTRSNTNRYFWNKLFIYALEYDKNYYGDDI